MLSAKDIANLLSNNKKFLDTISANYENDKIINRWATNPNKWTIYMYNTKEGSAWIDEWCPFEFDDYPTMIAYVILNEDFNIQNPITYGDTSGTEGLVYMDNDKLKIECHSSGDIITL